MSLLLGFLLATTNFINILPGLTVINASAAVTLLEQRPQKKFQALYIQNNFIAPTFLLFTLSLAGLYKSKKERQKPCPLYTFSNVLQIVQEVKLVLSSASERDSNSRPLRYRCCALPTELSKPHESGRMRVSPYVDVTLHLVQA